MNTKLIPLHQMPVGSVGIIKSLNLDGLTHRRMLDLGLIHNTIIKSLLKSPCGNPIAYEVRGTVIALRSEDASNIIVEKI